MANYRGGRINEEVKREISNIIQNEIKDSIKTIFGKFFLLPY